MPRHTNRGGAKALLSAIVGPGDSEMPRTGEGPDTYMNRMDARDVASGSVKPFSLPVGPHSKLPIDENSGRRFPFKLNLAGPAPGLPFGTPQSDNPNFKYARSGGLQIDANGVQSTRVQHMMDPEKHIEFTKQYPHDLGSTDVWHPSGERRTTAKVWEEKGAQAAEPATVEHSLLPGHIVKNPTHGAGITNSLWGGGKVRNAVNTITDPGEFGHPHPVQWEGHHRVAAAAQEQKRRRESGRKDWSVPVPVNPLYSADVADEMKANKAHLQPDTPGIPDYSRQVAGVSMRNALLGRGEGPSSSWSPEKSSVMSGRPYERPVTPLTKRQQVRADADELFKKGKHKVGGGFGTGTWNPKAY